MDRPIEVEWIKTSGGRWSVYCEINDAYRKHSDKIWRTPRLVEKIVERCQLIYQRISWNVRWMEVQFNRYGVGIEVDGVNGCYCAPHGGEYGDHNIDTADQALCIYLCLRTAMDEIEIGLSLWEEAEQEGRNVSLDPQPERALIFRYTKDLVPWALFEASVIHFDEPQLDFSCWIWTKGSYEAKRIAESQTRLFRSSVSVSEVTAGPAMVLVDLSQKPSWTR